MKVFVYILKSQKNVQFYVGSTTNVVSRVERHNAGLVESTGNFRPYIIELIQGYCTIRQAKQIEYRIKKLKRKDYIEKMILEKRIRMGR